MMWSARSWQTAAQGLLRRARRTYFWGGSRRRHQDIFRMWVQSCRCRFRLCCVYLLLCTVAIRNSRTQSHRKLKSGTNVYRWTCNGRPSGQKVKRSMSVSCIHSTNRIRHHVTSDFRTCFSRKKNKKSVNNRAMDLTFSWSAFTVINYILYTRCTLATVTGWMNVDAQCIRCCRVKLASSSKSKPVYQD